MDNIKRISMPITGHGHIEVEEHNKAKWIQFSYYELKQGFNKDGEPIERMYRHYFCLDQKEAQRFKEFLVTEK